MYKDEWPTEMITLSSNTHWSTAIEETLAGNTENAELILLSLLEALQIHFLKVVNGVQEREKGQFKKGCMDER